MFFSVNPVEKIARHSLTYFSIPPRSRFQSGVLADRAAYKTDTTNGVVGYANYRSCIAS